jgi:hypothetical protein
VTVARLATEAGYSERATFRLLTRLYREMDVNSRMEAIMQARLGISGRGAGPRHRGSRQRSSDAGGRHQLVRS